MCAFTFPQELNKRLVSKPRKNTDSWALAPHLMTQNPQGQGLRVSMLKQAPQVILMCLTVAELRKFLKFYFPSKAGNIIII